MLNGKHFHTANIGNKQLVVSTPMGMGGMKFVTLFQSWDRVAYNSIVSYCEIININVSCVIPLLSLK